MDFQVRGCGFISVTTVEGTSVTTAGQRQVVVFAALTANPTTPRKITSVTEARTNHGYTRLDSMVVRNSISRDCKVLVEIGKLNSDKVII
jgi:hypothetical protein